MRITYTPSKWKKLNIISKIGIIIFYLSSLTPFTIAFLEYFNVVIFKLPDYWLFVCVISALSGFFLAVIFDKGGKKEIGVAKHL